MSITDLVDKLIFFKCGTYLLLECILFIDILVGGSLDNASVCRKFHRGFRGNKHTESLLDIDSAICPPSMASVNVYHVTTNDHQAHNASVLLVCWSENVRQVAIQFEKPIQITNHDASSTGFLATCANPHDTFYYLVSRGDTNRHATIVLPFVASKATTIKIYYSEIRADGKHTNHRRALRTYYQDINHTIERRKRSPEINVTSHSECGTTRSCYRNGGQHCGHFECTYFMSCSASSDTIDIELSAKTSGWVALGFSSDTTMGDDEEVVCMLTQQKEPKVTAAIYFNEYDHSKPIKKSDQSVITLIYGTFKDDFVYCHVTMSLHVVSGVYMDLTNEWHQLYAYGPISLDGEMAKHTRTPLVSNKISVVRMTNIVNVSPSLHSCYLFYAVLIIFLFITY